MAAENLKTALRQGGREDRVVCHLDNLALGPIEPPDPQTRQAWIGELDWANLEDVEQKLPDPVAFWNEALREDVRKVAWLSRRSAPEYCAFLEWLWRLGELPCEAVDLTDMTLGSGRPALGLSLLYPEASPHCTLRRWRSGRDPQVRSCAVSRREWAMLRISLR